jgi:hypothetical protein
MTLIDNIKAIHGGSIFTIGVEDALLFEKKVFKNNEDVGLSDRKINYFYTRYDDRPIKIQKSKNKFSSCYPYEVVSPKILVLQFKDFDLDGIMYAVLNEFNKNYDSTTYEVGQVEIRKEIILKDEIGEIKPFEGTHVLKFYYTESKPLNDCTEITCNGTEVIPITNEVLIYINDVLQYTQECNTDLELTLINQDGAPITATFNGTEIVVNQPVAADARVSNSDDSYDVNVASGGDLELPDITISNSDDSYLVTSPSVVDIELPDITVQNSDLSYNIIEPSINNITLPDEAITINSAAFITKPSKKDQDILLKDVSGTTITPVSLSGNTITILDAVVGGSKGLMPIQTGQTTSYATNDDGDLQRGRLTDFNTIPYNNPFGNTFRFTDELGGQTFTNNIVIDWSTWDGGSSVNGYCFSEYSSQTGTQIWDDWMLNSPYTCSTFGDWYLVNFQEMTSLLNMNETYGMDGYPFNIPATSQNRMLTSTTHSVNTAQALFKSHNLNYVSTAPKTNVYRAMLVRIFTISGTTLS